MFGTSADILNIIKALSILTVALLGSWGLYYLVMILKEIFRIIKETRGMFNKIEEIVETIKEKIDHSTSYLFLMSEGVKKLVDVIGKYTSKKEEEKKE